MNFASSSTKAGPGSRSPDESRERDVEKLDSVKDLPQYMRPLHLASYGFNSQDASHDQFVVLGVPGYDEKNEKGDHPKNKQRPKVWLVIDEQYQKNMAMFFALRKRLTERFEIEKILTTDRSRIGVIHEMRKESEDSGRIGQDNAVNRYFDDLLSRALKKKVSDIHIEVRLSGISKIRFRRHGMLVDENNEVPSQFIDKVCRGVYDTQADDEGKAEAFRDDEELSASISRTINNESIKLRFQSLVAYPKGYDVVLRILRLDKDEKYTELEDLGYSPDQVEQLKEIVERPIGALFISGVTGSGKSTTLKNIIMWLNHTREYSYKFYTIEDPPEYLIPHVTQIPVRQVDTGTDINQSPYLGPLKAAMRGDPDVIMIGEIRDHYTADGAKKATQSGHQVLTTLHAPSAMGSMERLRDFQLTPSTLGSQDFVAGLVYQRLLPILCPVCSKLFSEVLSVDKPLDAHIKLANRLQEALGDHGVANVRINGNNPDCEACMGTGVSGRTVCAEIVQPDLTMLRLFRSDKMVEAFEYWRSMSDRDPLSDKMAGKTVLEHGLHKVAMGKVSPVDLEKLVARVNTAVRQYKELDDVKRNSGSQEDAPRVERRAAWES